MSVSAEPDVVAVSSGHRFLAPDAGFSTNAWVELDRQSKGLSKFAARLDPVDHNISNRKA